MSKDLPVNAMGLRCLYAYMDWSGRFSANSMMSSIDLFTGWPKIFNNIIIAARTKGFDAASVAPIVRTKPGLYKIYLILVSLFWSIFLLFIEI